jgi:hypothetical protein
MNAVQRNIFSLIATTALAAPLYSQSEQAANIVTVGDADTELKSLKARLKDIRNLLSALERTITAPGLGTQVLEAQKAYENADQNFKAGNWTIAINESKRFLDLTQKPEHKTWLRAQFILARGLEETGQPKNATKAYLNYLATLATSREQGQQELTEVIGRLVRLATKNTKTPQAELSKFISSLVASNQPIEISDQVKYLSGVASSNIGKRGLAVSWLEEADQAATSPDTRARSKYFKALIAIHDQNWPMASQQLDGVINIVGVSHNLKDLAHLSLARVLIKQQKPNLALKNYDSINESSDCHRDANLEKIFLLIQQGRSDDALKTSHLWLTKYPNHEDAIHVKSIVSWLDLKTGNLDAAKSGIERTQQLLTRIRADLKSGFNRKTFTKGDADRLDALTRGHVANVQELDDIRAMFRQLDDLSERLAEIDGVERGLIFALARGDLRQFKPALANQLLQYDALADETLQAGSKLIYLDRLRLEGQLTDLDKQRLDANARRRAEIFSKYERLRRQSQRWLAWAPEAEQLAALARNWERLDLIAGESVATSVVSEKDPEATNLQDRIKSAREDMLATLRSLQTVRAANLTSQSELTDSLDIFKTYESFLGEDMTILAAYSPSATSTSEKLDDSDARAVREEWTYTANALKLSMLELSSRAHKDVVGVLSSLEKSDRAKSQLLADINTLQSVLESSAVEQLPSIISQFDYAIGQRMGKQLKWAGDLEYLKYAESTNAQDAARRRHELEKQILSDNLRGSEQRSAK